MPIGDLLFGPPAGTANLNPNRAYVLWCGRNSIACATPTDAVLATMTGLVSGPNAILDEPIQYDHVVVYVMIQRYVDCPTNGRASLGPRLQHTESAVDRSSCHATYPVNAKTGKSIYGEEIYRGFPTP